MNGRRNAKHYKNNTVTLITLKYSATVIVHICIYADINNINLVITIKL